MHSSMRENLLGWHDYFMRKKGEKAWRVTLLCLFWTLFGRRGIEEILIMLSSQTSNQICFFVYLQEVGQGVYKGSHDVYIRFCRLVQPKVRRGIFLFLFFVTNVHFVYFMCTLHHLILGTTNTCFLVCLPKKKKKTYVHNLSLLTMEKLMLPMQLEQGINTEKHIIGLCTRSILTKPNLSSSFLNVRHVHWCIQYIKKKKR